MEKLLQDINNYFALINVKAFCEKYDLAYETVRRVLKGDKIITEKFSAKILLAIHHFEKDQRDLKQEFHQNYFKE